jgi:glycosidase
MKTDKYILYQTFPRLFGNYTENPVKNGKIEENGCGKFNSYTPQALHGIKELGVTHIWYTGVIAHATGTDYSGYGIPKDHPAIVKGKAGSPYAITDYFDVDTDLAENAPNRMNEFVELVRRTHDAGMKVIIDFVPNHVARSYRSLMKPAYVNDLGQNDQTTVAFSPSNNFYYLPGQRLMLQFGAQEEEFEYSEFPAKVTGNDCFTTNLGVNDWYETIKLNYGMDYIHGGSKHFSPIPDTWQKMLQILLFWVDKNVDGFRCDMAEMVPVEFWNWVIPRVKSRKNVLFIAEIYNLSRYQEFISTGHFDFLYDKVGTYDLLRDLIVRKTSVSHVIQHLHAHEQIKDKMLFFLENHDEQRIASDFLTGDASAGLPALAFISTFGSNPVMIYNGQEVGEKGMDEEGFSGQDGRTTIFDYWRMDSIRRWANNGRFDGGLLASEQQKLRAAYKKILRLTQEEDAISMGAFYGLAHCNYDNPFFPSDKMMAYLRKYKHELILVCINFDDQAYHIRLRIPKKAFDLMQIPDNTVSRLKTLLSGEGEEESVCALTYACPFHGFIPAKSAKILKFSY